MIKKIFIGLLIIVVAIQFVRPQKNISTRQSTNDIAAHFNVPDSVLTILKRSCYDCHSNNTVYPWYYTIQPVAWWMADHVNTGKKEVNFSEFASYTPKRQRHKLHEVIDQIKKDEMPMDSYLWIHHDARLSDEQKNQVVVWADSLKRFIEVKNNLPPETEDD